MTGKRYPIPDETLAQQARAADPRNSAWVSANAGAGKTHVLSQRVIRLLLEGCDPSKILCLTYTRAAAANMSGRVFSRLAEWTTLDDAGLFRRIAALEGRRPGPEKLRRARKLFAEALDTPGGLKIQTIHAFCESVLQQFPIEANVAGRFTLLDRRMETALLAEARREMLTGAAARGAGLAEAFATVLERAGEHGLEALIGEIMLKREALQAFIAGISRGSAERRLLFEEFGFAPGESAATIAGSIWPLPGFSSARFQDFVAAAREVDARQVLSGIVPDAEQAFAEADPVKRLNLLAKAFLRDNGRPYESSVFRKALIARLPDLADRYREAAAALVGACDRLALFRMLEGTWAALVIARWLIARYAELKSARGFLDFDDLITRTVRLLARQDAAAWVQYKLDQGIDHILLDEAQDTSPEQWNVVTRLAEEFFSGAGARDHVRRTIFAVGDEKQSIYSFQGAVPEAFAETGQLFAGKVREARAAFEPVRLTLSFRSTNDVLRALDKVFESQAARRGVTRDPNPVRHDAVRFDAPGYVEIWPSVGATEVDEPEDWTQAVDHARAPAVVVAERVAGTIEHWLRTHEVIEGTGRKLTPGDVMVLVRKRDRFVHALSRSLKDRRIPVAGADRLALPAHIAVKDLMALGRFLVQQEDDLSLAAVLRSPIFGLGEEALFDLAARRQHRSLFSSLKSQAPANPAFAGIAAQLEGWAGEAAFLPVFEFYARVLAGRPGVDGVRRKMIARLGPEAGDIIDEFLNFTLAEERAGLPGLEAFLATLESAAPEIKREMDQGRNEIRIMTVHAAKGLEAPVVFLVDSGAAPFSDQHLPRLLSFETSRIGWRGTGFLWRSGADVANDFSRKAADRVRERGDDEYRRLLYVGMTRAEDRLIVCGYHGKRPPPPRAWHALVTEALGGLPETIERRHPVTGQPVSRFRVSAVPALQPELGLAPPERRFPPLPAHFFDAPPAEDDLPDPLSPSGASVLVEPAPAAVLSGRSPVLDGGDEAGFAAARGIVIHKLLQMLPAVAGPEREAAAQRYLDRAAADWPETERSAAWRQVRDILEDARFAPLFAENSRAEVSVMGELVLGGRKRSVSGKIDRLAVTDDAVVILDYKSNRPAPVALGEVPPAYLLQLALYGALVKPLFPGRRISAALLFSEVPRLISVPEAELDRALARLTLA